VASEHGTKDKENENQGSIGMPCHKKETRLLSVFIIFGKSFATWLQISFPVQLIQRISFFKNVPKGVCFSEITIFRQ